MLGPDCILMGSAKEANPGDGTQGSAENQAGKASASGKTSAKSQPRRKVRSSKKQQELLLTDCVQKMLTVMLVLLARMPESVAFRVKDCNNQGTQI